MTEKEKQITEERNAPRCNGFLGLLLALACAAGGIITLVYGITHHQGGLVFLFAFLVLCTVLMLCSLVVVQPNTAAVVTFFGKYTGVIRKNGIWMLIPFSSAKKVSLRVRNFNTEKLKVNDTNGNPVEIAAVVVFRVVDAAKALLDVDDYEKFVEIQSETSLRHVAAQYPYDDFDEGCFSLRSNSDQVSQELLEELQQRLSIAGVEIMEARLTHLAYATEIASAMLQRQQASAILAARQIIVDGAVGMAQIALHKLEEEGDLELDPERRANMVNNLMVAIISDRSSQPVINVGSMY